jgi:hypothetical protein
MTQVARCKVQQNRRQPRQGKPLSSGLPRNAAYGHHDTNQNENHISARRPCFRNALDSALARLEEDMKEHDLATPEITTTQVNSEQPVQWEWDDHRQDHYYWVAGGYFKYHKGGRVRPGGTPYGEVGGGQLLLEERMIYCVSKDCRFCPNGACCLEGRMIVETRKNREE